MRTKLIFLELVGLVAAIGLFVGMETESMKKDSGQSQGKENIRLFPTLQVSNIDRIKISRGEDKIVLKRRKENKKEQNVSLKGSSKQKSSRTRTDFVRGNLSPELKGEWKLASFHDFPVKKDLVEKRIIRPLRTMKRGELRSTEKSNLKQYKLDEESAKTITLLNENGGVIQSIALGAQVKEGFKQVEGLPSIPSSEEEQNGDSKKQQKKNNGSSDKNNEKSGTNASNGERNEESKIFYYLKERQGNFEVRLGRGEFSSVKLDPQEWVKKQILDFDREKINLIAVRKKVKKNTDKNESETSKETDSEEKENESEEKQNDSEGNKKTEQQTEKTRRWFVFYRRKKNTPEQQSDQENGENKKNQEDSGKSENGGSESNAENETEFTDWKASVTDEINPQPFRNSRYFQIGLPGFQKEAPQEKTIQQRSVNDAYDTLSSFEAKNVLDPLEVKESENKVDEKKLIEHGLKDPEVLVLFGKWHPSKQLLKDSVPNYQNREQLVEQMKEDMKKRGIPSDQVQNAVDSIRNDLDKLENLILFEPVDRLRFGVFYREKEQSSPQKGPNSDKSKKKNNGKKSDKSTEKEIDEVFASRPYRPGFFEQMASKFQDKMGYIDAPKTIHRIPLYKIDKWDFNTFGKPESELIVDEDAQKKQNAPSGRQMPPGGKQRGQSPLKSKKMKKALREQMKQKMKRKMQKKQSQQNSSDGTNENNSE